MTTTTATAVGTARPTRRQWLAFAAIVAALAATLFGINAWMESQGEDAAPVWNCYTMGNHQCGPNSPWHGFYFGAVD